MAEFTVSTTCGLYAYTLNYDATSCAGTCSGSTVTVYSSCSSLTTNCYLYASDGLYANTGYYSDGTICYTVTNPT